MTANLPFWLILAVTVGYVVWTGSQARAIVDQWAARTGYTIAQAELRHLRTGPFFWKNFTKQPVYYVRVLGADGRQRAAWVRCCVLWSRGSGDAEVRWDEPVQHVPDAGLGPSPMLLSDCLRNRAFKIGLGVLVFGTGPLNLIILLSKMGIGDPNPNPVGPGILAGLSVPIGLTCAAAGFFRVVSARAARSN
jgi:hypothetical protein